MAADPKTQESQVRRLAEAAAWHARLTDQGAESSVELETWLAADPANTAMWERVQRGWNVIGEAALSPELIAARRNALDRARRRRTRSHRGLMASALAACLLLAAGLGVVIFAGDRIGLPTQYGTARGERRVITLADGSRVSLDAGSTVRVRFTGEARRLELLAGQARFDVAHDKQRPFSVKVRGQTVVATGTAFNIDLSGPEVRITLIEGRITVLGASVTKRPSGGPQAATPVVLAPGQSLLAAPMRPATIEVASLDRVTAWQSGQLIFDDEPLEAVAERISRYATHPVRVDPAVRGVRISGVFNAGDTASFVDAVVRYLPVEAASEEDGAILLRARS